MLFLVFILLEMALSFPDNSLENVAGIKNSESEANNISLVFIMPTISRCHVQGNLQGKRVRFPSSQSLPLEQGAHCCMSSTQNWHSVQFSTVAQSCPTLCDPMNCSTPGLPVHHQLPEFTQTLVHRVRDAIQPSHPLSSPSPPALNPSQHQSLFQ